MSINPLFSGPGQYSRNPPSRSPLGVLANSASNLQQSGEMESVTPRKKPRLNSAGNTNSETEDGADPFGDFEEESFTADDLAAIDLIATQAFSQATTDDVNNSRGKSAAGSAPRTQFSASKQTSRNYLHPKNVFPVNGITQNKNRDGSPSVGFKAKYNSSSARDSASQPPLYLQNKVQTNVDIPFHQLGKGNSKLLSSQVETRTNNFRRKTNTSTGGEGSSQENHLTPPKGTTVVDFSALPSGTQDESSQLQKLRQQIERYRCEAEALTQQLKSLKSEKYNKDGEIEVLRQNLNKAQTDISRLKMERIQEDEQQKREQVSKEKELQKEVETLKTQLEFKDREIIEAQTSFRNLQQRTLQMDEQKSSRDTFPSPRKSPKLVHVTSPPKRTNFPSRASLVAGSSKHPKGADSPKPSRPHREEQKRSSTCKSPGSSAISGGSPTCGLTNKVFTPPSLGAAVQIKTRFPNDPPALKTKAFRNNYHRNSIGTQLYDTPKAFCCVTPSQMVGLLMKKIETETYDEPMQDDGHIMGLYHGPSEILNKHSSDSGAGQSSRICQSEAKELQKPSSCMTASLSISRLLNPPPDTLEPLQVPLPRHPSATSTSSAFTTSHLANLLPHLQELLDNYLQELEKLVAANTPSTRKYNRSNSVPDQTEYLTEMDNVLRSQEQNLGLGLQALNRLCSHSEPVCKIIVAGFDQTQEEMDISVDEIDPSAPIISTQSGSRSSSSVSSSSSVINPFSREPCRILQVLQLVLKSNPVKDHPPQKLRELGWKVVCTLSRNCPKSHVKWCIPFLVQGSLSLALSSCSTLCTKVQAVTAAAFIAAHQSICSQSDSCPLLYIYRLSLQTESTEDGEDDVTSLRLGIIDLLLTIVASSVSGTSLLVETNCQCSYEVVGAVVFMLFEELKIAERNNFPQRTLILKQGLLLLHTIAMQTRAMSELKIETEMELTQLVVRLLQFLKNSSLIDKNETNMLQDLWECVAGDDDDDDILEDEAEEMQAMETK